MSEELNLLRRIATAVETLAGMRLADAGGGVADDRDLDSRYGNPTVKFNPRDWHGDDCKGREMSECPVEFLDLLAGTFDYFARKADENGETTNAGKPVAPYKRKDAARARGWAQRIRSGAHTQGHRPAAGGGTFDVTGFEDVTDTEIPF